MATINEQLTLPQLQARLVALDATDCFTLNLNDNSLETILHDFLPASFSNLVSIKLERCQCRRIASTTFDSLVNVEHISLNENRLRFLPVKLFAHCVRLKYLSLRHNNIDVFIVWTLNGLRSLRELDISFNRIESVRLFEHNTLAILHLNNNRIRDFSRNSFRRLVYLNLSSNRLRVLDARTFHTMRSLHELNVSTNRISVLARYTFWLNTKLNRVRINDNLLQRFHMNSFAVDCPLQCLEIDKNASRLTIVLRKRTPHLKTLSVENNTHLKIVNFDSLVNLRRLSIKGTVFRPCALPSLNMTAGSLHYLNIGGNCRHRLYNRYFWPLRQLKILILDATPADKFVWLDQPLFDVDNLLQRLSMSGCGLVELHPSVFGRLSRLTHLDLSRNELTAVTATVFEDLVQLRYLLLNANSLALIETNAFANLKELFTLDLSHNSLSVLNRNVFGVLAVPCQLLLDSHVRLEL